MRIPIRLRPVARLMLVALLGVAAATLVSCASSGKGLIPTANGTALQGDFEAVARAAASGNGSCGETESALGKTEQDFLALPVTIDHGLHAHLQEGIRNLRKRALEMCAQLSPTATSTTATETTPTATTTAPTTSTETTPTNTTTTTTPTQTTPTTATPPGQSGGTEASGEGEEVPGKGKGKAEGESEGNAGGANVGGASPGGGQ
jgi:hypothetical protein